MSNKVTAFYRRNTSIQVDFSKEEISSDGALVLLEKLERKHGLIKYFSQFLPDKRNPIYVVHSIEKMLKQRVFLLMQGYKDCNDESTLKNDPIIEHILDSHLASQPTLSRFENSLDKHSIFELCYAWLDRYVNSLKGRKKFLCLIVFMAGLFIMNCFFTMEKQERLSYQFYVQVIAILTSGMSVF